MRNLILLLPIFLTACERPVEYVEAKPVIPAELLEPAPISMRIATTYRDLAILATEHLNSALTANARIEAISEIVRGD